ncbi:hypothetical protein NFI96_024238 [Prochilodus magdalenae]|nr:hypothetical protein NFI96_024238 [Prochilodus magdalenae]
MEELQDLTSLDTFADLEKYFTVFEGSSQENVAYAKVFWNSLSLQPPVESSLVSVDIRQRLKVARTPQPTHHAARHSAHSKNDEILQRAYQKQMEDERKRYLEMAKKRDEIMMLLKKQREERIKHFFLKASAFLKLATPEKGGVDWAGTQPRMGLHFSLGKKKEMISLQHKPRRSDPPERYQRRFRLLYFRSLWGRSGRGMMLCIAYDKSGMACDRALH